jgi:hypothetical protein
MTEKLFDSFVKEKLEHYSSPVPGGLWKKIIAGKGISPKGFWRISNTGLVAISIGITVTVLLTGGYFLLNNQKPNQPVFPSAKNTSPVLSSENNLSRQKELSDSTGFVTGPTYSPASSQNEKSTTGNGRHSLAGGENITWNKTDLRSKRKEPAVDKNITENNNSSAGAGSSGMSKQIVILSGIGKQNVIPSGISKQNDVQSTVAGNNKNNRALTVQPGSNYFTFTNNQNTNQPGNTDEKSSGVSLLKKESTLGELVRLAPYNLYNLNNLQQLPPLNLRNIFGLGYDCPSAAGNQRKNWFLEIYASPDYSIKYLSGKGLNSTYLQKKDSTERMRLGYTAGARISTTVGDHFMLKTGLQYSQINEHFSQRIENETQTITVIISRTITRPQQGDTTFKDTTSLTQVGYVIKSSRNHYNNIEIPVSLGYEFGQEKDPWKLAVNGGAIFDITSFYSGETLDTAFNIVSVSAKNNTDFYKKEVGVSLFGSLSLIHNINNHLDVFAEPYFKYSLSNLSSTIGYSQKFNTFGLMLGIRLKLNNKQHF